MTTHLKKRLGGAAFAVMLAVGSAIAMPTTSHAGAIVCDPGETWYSVSNVSSKWVVTHVSKKHIATGQSLKVGVKVTSSLERTLSAEFTANASLAVSAGVDVKALFAKAGSKAGFGLKTVGSRTETSSVTVTNDSSFAAVNYERDFAVYKGYKQVTSDGKMTRCSSDRLTIKTVWTGSFKSFGPGTADADYALCTKTTHPSGSLEQKACAAIS